MGASLAIIELSGDSVPDDVIGPTVDGILVVIGDEVIGTGANVILLTGDRVSAVSFFFPLFFFPAFFFLPFLFPFPFFPPFFPLNSGSIVGLEDGSTGCLNTTGVNKVIGSRVGGAVPLITTGVNKVIGSRVGRVACRASSSVKGASCVTTGVNKSPGVASGAAFGASVKDTSRVTTGVNKVTGSGVGRVACRASSSVKDASCVTIGVNKRTGNGVGGGC